MRLGPVICLNLTRLSPTLTTFHYNTRAQLNSGREAHRGKETEMIRTAAAALSAALMLTSPLLAQEASPEEITKELKYGAS